MKFKYFGAILLAAAITVPTLAAQGAKHGHAMKTKHAAVTKSKMRSLGHGVYMDAKGKYRSKDGKFMSKATADKLMGKHAMAKGPKRDFHGRFVKSGHTTKSSKVVKKKGGMMSKIKAKLVRKKK